LAESDVDRFLTHFAVKEHAAATRNRNLSARPSGPGRFRVHREAESTRELERRGFLEPAAERIKADLDLHSKAREVGSVDECRAAVEADPDKPDLKLKLAEALAAAGQYQEALEIGLELVREHKQQFGEPARKIMVDIFRLLPNDSELTSTYRRKLAAALY